MPRPVSTSADSHQLVPANTPATLWWLPIAGMLFLAIGSCEQTANAPVAPNPSNASASVPDSVGIEQPAAEIPVSTGAPTGYEDTNDDAKTPSAKIATRTASASDKYPLQTNPLAGCSICHVDVEDEFVPSRHFKERVGCQTCHGPSEAHLANENNEVKPDHVFGRQKVDALCSECHDCTRPNSETRIYGQDKKLLVCVDCHGHHTLARKEPDQLPQD